MLHAFDVFGQGSCFRDVVVLVLLRVFLLLSMLLLLFVFLFLRVCLRLLLLVFEFRLLFTFLCLFAFLLLAAHPATLYVWWCLRSKLHLSNIPPHLMQNAAQVLRLELL